MIMNAWFSNLIKKLKIPKIYYKVDVLDSRRPDLSEILNVALSLSMEFNPNLDKPINSRLRKVYPKLTRMERKGFDKYCQEIIANGRNYMKSHFDSIRTENDLEVMKKEFARKMRLGNSWINDVNVNTFFNQSYNYASK